MTGIQKKRIGVFSAEALKKHSGLWAALKQIFPVEFYDGASSRLDASIAFGADALPENVRSDGKPTFITSAGRGPAVRGAGEIHFIESTALPAACCGQRLSDPSYKFVPINPGSDDEVLATSDRLPLWMRNLRARGGGYTSAVFPFPLSNGELLYTRFEPSRWFELLPLLHFLREITRTIDWNPGPLRACIVFDDPNLHSSRYGFLDFRELVRHSQEHNYHVAIAMIPLDTWYASKRTTTLFRLQANRLSVLMHGNNHLRAELCGEDEDHQKLSLLAQALRRMQAFEQRTGIKVARVMAAPHGACSESTMKSMLMLGYEAACISTGSVVRSNPEKQWPLDFGLSPTGWMDNGFPVIQRFSFRGDPCLKARLMSVLGQAIVAYGHHHDCGSGMDFLAQFSATVNSIGPVHWHDMNSLVRSSYRTRAEGELLHVQMCSREIVIDVPEAISHIALERPWIAEGKTELLECTSQKQCIFRCVALKQTEPFPVPPRSRLEIRSWPDTRVDFNKVAPPRMAVWPPLRRVLCEFRDRTPKMQAFVKHLGSRQPFAAGQNR